MRISDWSSDVCSSDLLVHSLERRSPGPDQCFERRDFAGRAGVDPVAEGIDDKPRDPEPERRVDEDLAIVRLVVADRFQEVGDEPGIVKNFALDSKIIGGVLPEEKRSRSSGE